MSDKNDLIEEGSKFVNNHVVSVGTEATKSVTIILRMIEALKSQQEEIKELRHQVKAMGEFND